MKDSKQLLDLRQRLSDANAELKRQCVRHGNNFTMIRKLEAMMMDNTRMLNQVNAELSAMQEPISYHTFK